MATKLITTTRIIAILSLLFISSTLFSQDHSVIYIGTNGKLTTLDNAMYMQKINIKSPRTSKVQFYMLKDSKWEKTGSEQYIKLNDSTYQINLNLKNSKGIVLRTFVKHPDESFHFTDMVKGQTIRTGSATSVMPLLLHGQVTEYYNGGNKKSVSYYNNNELISNENWYEFGAKYMDNIFYSVDTYPSFNPGNKVIYNQILKAFKDANIDVLEISGSLTVGFVVMEDGKIDGIKIVKGLRPFINNIALKSFETLEGTWTPAKLNNQTVRYFQTFPINFINREHHLEYAEISGRIFHYSY